MRRSSSKASGPRLTKIGTLLAIARFLSWKCVFRQAWKTEVANFRIVSSWTLKKKFRF